MEEENCGSSELGLRLIAFVNNRLGWKIMEWLSDRDENIVGIVLHPHAQRKYGQEILEAVPDGAEVFSASFLREDETIQNIRLLHPDIGLSVLFDYILSERILEIFPKGILNLHPGYLPYNRGQYPNVWSIVDETPAGTTLHYLDPGIDTGPIVAQQRVRKEPIDTGGTLYRKLECASLKMFQRSWPKIIAGAIDPRPQDPDAGTYHRTDDVEEIDRINLGESYIARDLLNILRARTFPPHESAYFVQDGRKVYVRVDLEYADETESESKADKHSCEE